MFGTNKSAFTLIELLVAMALLGMLATIIIPNFQSSRPAYERKVFIGTLSALVRRAWQNAVVSGKVHRVAFDFDKRLIRVSMATGKQDAKGEPQFKRIPSTFLNSSYTWPNTIKFQQFIIEGFDELKRYSGRKTGEVWFFVVPEGLTQDVIINVVDTKDVLYNGKSRPVGLVLNPFTAQFKEYDAFQV